jgi:hypothetical protein
MVIYRVDGVSGLKDLTGIKTIYPSQQLLVVEQAINPVPVRERSYRLAIMLSVCFLGLTERRIYQIQSDVQYFF